VWCRCYDVVMMRMFITIYVCMMLFEIETRDMANLRELVTICNHNDARIISGQLALLSALKACLDARERGMNDVSHGRVDAQSSPEEVLCWDAWQGRYGRAAAKDQNRGRASALGA